MKYVVSKSVGVAMSQCVGLVIRTSLPPRVSVSAETLWSSSNNLGQDTRTNQQPQTISLFHHSESGIRERASAGVMAGTSPLSGGR